MCCNTFHFLNRLKTGYLPSPALSCPRAAELLAATAVPPDLSFNTAASFTTNTNWQNYAGETTMSYFTQMAGLAYHNFMSAAVGIALAIAFIRGIARREKETIGNFWVDMTRATLWILLPLCFLFAFVAGEGYVILGQDQIGKFLHWESAWILLIVLLFVGFAYQF